MNRTDVDHSGVHDVGENSGTVPVIAAKKDKERKENSRRVHRCGKYNTRVVGVPESQPRVRVTNHVVNTRYERPSLG